LFGSEKKFSSLKRRQWSSYLQSLEIMTARCCSILDFSNFFLIGIVGGGVQLGPLGTAATNRPIVPALGDYDDGEIGGIMISRGNQSTRRKPIAVPLCPPQTPHACLDANPGRCSGKPTTNRFSYGTAFILDFPIKL
jgi:hypothetical protein